MRSRGIRLDLFICMLIASALFGGIIFVGEKLEVLDKTFEVLSVLLDGTKNVPDGEVGGYGTEDTPRVSTVEELRTMAQEGKTFTIETAFTRYSNYGTFVGENYEWRILELDDGNAIAVKLNTDKVQEDDSYNVILPVGRMVLEQPGALEDMKEELLGSNVPFFVDVYIDMDGEAKTTYISPNQQMTMIVLGIVMMALPLVTFVLYMVSIFAIHSVFVKKGIFPPVFPNKNI